MGKKRENLNKHSTSVSRQPENIVITRDIVNNNLLSIFWFGLGSMFLMGILVNLNEIGLLFILSPFVLITFFAGYYQTKTINHVIIANENGLLVDDFSKIPIQWGNMSNIHITRYDYKNNICELSISVKNVDLLSPRINLRPFSNRITLCNLSHYKVNYQILLERLTYLHTYYIFHKSQSENKSTEIL